jgi:hypothetical protein
MKILLASSVPALVFASTAFGECSNLVLNMKDTKTGREITSILDCHDASATIPGATTMHFMEWKSGKLCQSIQNCGNVKFWKGSLSVGANWYWGDSITKFKQTTDSWNKFAQLAREQSAGQDYATSGGVYRCTDFKHWQEFEQGGHVKGTSGFYMNSSTYQQFESSHCGYGDYYNQSCGGIAFGGDQNRGFFVEGENARSWLATRGNSGEVLTCGYLDRAFAQSYDEKEGSLLSLENGKLSTKGSSDTSWSTDGIHANFALDFGQINRSCRAVQNFGCL